MKYLIICILFLSGCIHPYVGICVAPPEFYSGWRATTCQEIGSDEDIACTFVREHCYKDMITLGCGDWRVIKQECEDVKETSL